jgi:3-oxo-5-alpha-steroid 4-dehydrogenase 3 / polyprenol reductase
VYNLIGPPSAKSFFGVLLFIFGSGLQHDCHAYLASLEKYTLPVHAAFDMLVCPHYFAECLIYLSLAIISAPSGHGPVNITMMTVLVFVGVNLGVTSMISREWYEAKFGKKAVERE